jgi:hypothetical protein
MAKFFKHSLNIAILATLVPLSNADAASGLIFKDDCNTIPAPEIGKTICSRNLPPYGLYIWNGIAWALITGNTTLVTPGAILVAGGNIVWQTGYTFLVGNANYYINGNFHMSPLQSVTLATPDAAYDRIDAFVVNEAGVVSSVTGTPGPTPYYPPVDPREAVALGYALVTHGTTAPANLTVTQLYNEGTAGEWNATATAATYTINSTNNPYSGTKDVEGTDVLADQALVLTNLTSGWATFGSNGQLVFYMRLKQPWPADGVIHVTLGYGGVIISDQAEIAPGSGFDAGLINAYQLVTITASQFGVAPDRKFDRIWIRPRANTTPANFYWDWVQVQTGIIQTTPNLPGGSVGALQYNAGGGRFGGFGFYNPAVDKLFLGSPSGDIIVYGKMVTAGGLQLQNLGTSTQCLQVSGSGSDVTGTGVPCGAGAGTVSSVAQTVPPEFTIAGSPVTTTGTLAIGKSTQTANTVWAGPTSGGAAAPTFRTLVAADVPAATLSVSQRTRVCTVVIGDPGFASPPLSDDNDSPVACTNDYGADWTITSVACYGYAASPTVTPIMTGGSATSILTGALTCGTNTWAAGTLNGTPVVKSFSANGTTCAVTPCSIDVNITTAGGISKYLVVKIVGTIP